MILYFHFLYHEKGHFNFPSNMSEAEWFLIKLPNSGLWFLPTLQLKIFSILEFKCQILILITLEWIFGIVFRICNLHWFSLSSKLNIVHEVLPSKASSYSLKFFLSSRFHPLEYENGKFPLNVGKGVWRHEL